MRSPEQVNVVASQRRGSITRGYRGGSANSHDSLPIGRESHFLVHCFIKGSVKLLACAGRDFQKRERVAIGDGKNGPVRR